MGSFDPIQRARGYGNRRRDRQDERSLRRRVAALEAVQDAIGEGTPSSASYVEAVDELPDAEASEVGRQVAVIGDDTAPGRILTALPDTRGVVRWVETVLPAVRGRDYFWDDHFLNHRNWGYTGQGAVNPVPAAAPRPGIVEVTSGGANGNTGRLFLGQNETAEVVDGDRDYEMIWDFRPVDTANVTIRIGSALDWGASPPLHGDWLEFSTAAGHATWQYARRFFGNPAVYADTGIAPVALDFVRLRMRKVGAFDLYWQIGNGPEVKRSAATTYNEQPGVQIRTHTGSQKRVYLNYFSVLLFGLGG